MEHSNPKIVRDERLDRVEIHLRHLKDNMETLTENSNKISHALVGNEFTGNSGLIHRVKQIDDITIANAQSIKQLQDSMKLIVWFGTTIGGLIIAFIMYILQNKISL